MKKSIYWLTETAMLLALLIGVQSLGAFIPVPLTKQLITGSLVNCVLAVTVLTVGMSSGITVALCSPVFAYLLKIAPNAVTVLPIMAGNLCYVVLLKLIMGKNMQPAWKQPVALTCASAVKFTVLYLLVVKLLAPKMKKPMLLMFSWPQLVTALVGGALALAILPLLKKTIKIR